MVVLVGGSNSYRYLTDVEVYSPSGNCNRKLPPLPHPTLDPIVFYAGGALLVCAGRREFGPAGAECLRYYAPDDRDGGHDLGRWVEHTGIAMRHYREAAAYAKTKDGRVYVSGGWHAPKSMEYFDPKRMRWVEGEELPRPKSRHCMVATSDGVLILGGERSREVGHMAMDGLGMEHKTDLFTYR